MNRDIPPGDGYEEDGLFQTVMFGYDRTQVDDYVDALCDELHLLSGAVKRMTPMENDLLGAQAEIHRLREIVSAGTPSALATTRIQQMLKLAEEESTALHEEGQQVLDQARQDAEEIRRAAEIDSEHVASARRREYQRLREDIIAGAHAEAARITAEANMRTGGLALATNVKNGLGKTHPGVAASARNAPAKNNPAGSGATKNAAKKRTAPKPAED